jgi:hypothetical protein
LAGVAELLKVGWPAAAADFAPLPAPAAAPAHQYLPAMMHSQEQPALQKQAASTAALLLAVSLMPRQPHLQLPCCWFLQAPMLQCWLQYALVLLLLLVLHLLKLAVLPVAAAVPPCPGSAALAAAADHHSQPASALVTASRRTDALQQGLLLLLVLTVLVAVQAVLDCVLLEQPLLLLLQFVQVARQAVPHRVLLAAQLPVQHLRAVQQCEDGACLIQGLLLHA